MGVAPAQCKDTQIGTKIGNFSHQTLNQWSNILQYLAIVQGSQLGARPMDDVWASGQTPAKSCAALTG